MTYEVKTFTENFLSSVLPPKTIVAESDIEALYLASQQFTNIYSIRNVEKNTYIFKKEDFLEPDLNLRIVRLQHPSSIRKDLYIEWPSETLKSFIILN